MEQQWLKTLGEKLMDAANLGFGGLIVGQIIAKEFRLDWTLWGLGIWVGFYLLGSLLIFTQERWSFKR
jgi:hypothetical protein